MPESPVFFAHLQNSVSVTQVEKEKTYREQSIHIYRLSHYAYVNIYTSHGMVLCMDTGIRNG
jgi:hypothetical protein